MPGSIIAPVIGGLFGDDNGAEGANDAAAAASRLQAELAQKQWARREKFFPLEDKYIQESFDYGSPEATQAEVDRQVGAADADVSQAFGLGLDAIKRNTSRFGSTINPNAMQSQANAFGLQNAATRVNALTNARNAAEEKMLARRRQFQESAMNHLSGLGANSGALLGESARTNAQLAANGQAMGLAQARGIGQMVDRGLNSPTGQSFMSGLGSRMSNAIGGSVGFGGAGSRAFGGSVQGNSDYEFDI